MSVFIATTVLSTPSLCCLDMQLHVVNTSMHAVVFHLGQLMMKAVDCSTLPLVTDTMPLSTAHYLA